MATTRVASIEHLLEEARKLWPDEFPRRTERMEDHYRLVGIHQALRYLEERHQQLKSSRLMGRS